MNMRRTLNDFKPKLELTAKLLFVVWLKRCNTPFGEATDATASRRRGAFCTRPTAVRRPPKRPTKGGVGGREKLSSLERCCDGVRRSRMLLHTHVCYTTCGAL